MNESQRSTELTVTGFSNVDCHRGLRFVADRVTIEDMMFNVQGEWFVMQFVLFILSVIII